MNRDTGHDNISIGQKITGICGSVVRTTVKFIRNIPSRVQNYVRRKVKEYKRKPKRDDVNKVYVLVGYATKEHIDAKHNAERNLIILNKGLLLIIFFLLLFISINAILPYIDTTQYQDMFGISSVEEVTRNDPFSGSTTPTSSSAQTTQAEVYEQTSST